MVFWDYVRSCEISMGFSWDFPWAMYEISVGFLWEFDGVFEDFAIQWL